MKTAVTFEDVCRFVMDKDPELQDTLEQVVGLALIVLPFLVDPSGLGLSVAADALGVKSELAKGARTLLTKISGKREPDPAERYERMAAAYCLLCFTSFFDAFDKSLPKIAKTAGLKRSESFQLVEAAAERVGRKTKHEPPPTPGPKPIPSVNMPHPAEAFEDQKEGLNEFYQALTHCVGQFLPKLSVWDELDDTARDRAGALVAGLPEQALKQFETQYYALAVKCPEFLVWSGLQHQKNTAKRLATAREEVRQLLALLQEHRAGADVGFSRLSATIDKLPSTIRQERTDTVLSELSQRYLVDVDRPLLEDDRRVAPEGPELLYPRRLDAFIPQPFKVVRYTGHQRLGDESFWDQVESRSDLASFLLAYITSPYAASAPLLIIGHPGSGKSLLLDFVAARFADTPFTPIKVVLRDANADTEMHAQVTQQIARDLERAEDEWAELCSRLTESPPLLLLDGYDELLQASGKVFAGYLRKVQQFQRDQLRVRDLPIRAIVTSRIALIDKADMPTGTTVVRLQPFDDARIKQWIGLWNDTNQGYFGQTDVQPFALPPNAPSISSLAEQPLLLLLLAVYDGHANALRDHAELGRTALYDSLLRDCVRRDREKDATFCDLAPERQEGEIDADMERLGVAALGMFNRRSLHITADQLNSDLRFFKMERSVPPVTEGRQLSQADLLLGSFFFIYRSKARGAAGEQPGVDDDVAFEFLHNTFGEFLTGDFILRAVVTEARRIQSYQEYEDLQPQLPDELDRPGQPVHWARCLSHTPLYTRPVILEMMVEWLPYRCQTKRTDPEKFAPALRPALDAQFQQALSSPRPMPQLAEEGMPFERLPSLGHLANYTVNLATIGASLLPDGYSMVQGHTTTHPDGAPLWDRLIHVWRGWFSLEALRGLAAVLSAVRDVDGQVRLVPSSPVQSTGQSSVSAIADVSFALAEAPTDALASLMLYHPCLHPHPGLEEIVRRLPDGCLGEEPMLRLALMERAAAARRWEYGMAPRHARPRRRVPHGRDQEAADKFLQHLLVDWGPREADWPPELIIELLRVLRDFPWITQRREFAGRFLHDILMRWGPRGPEWPREFLIEALRLLRDVPWGPEGREFSERFLHDLLMSWGPRETELSPEFVIEVLRVLRDIPWFFGGPRSGTRLLHELLMGSDPGEEDWQPEVILEMLRLLRDIPWGREGREGGDFAGRFVHRLLTRIEPGLTHWPPEVAIEALRMLRDVPWGPEGREFSERFLHELLMRWEPGDADWSPELMVEVLRLLRDAPWAGEGRERTEFRTEFLRDLLVRMGHREVDWPPELLIEVLQLLRDTSLGRRDRGLGPRMLHDLPMRSPVFLERYPPWVQEELVVALVTVGVRDELPASWLPAVREALPRLPIGCIAALRRSASAAGDDELLADIDRMTTG